MFQGATCHLSFTTQQNISSWGAAWRRGAGDAQPGAGSASGAMIAQARGGEHSRPRKDASQNELLVRLESCSFPWQCWGRWWSGRARIITLCLQRSADHRQGDLGEVTKPEVSKPQLLVPQSLSETTSKDAAWGVNNSQEGSDSQRHCDVVRGMFQDIEADLTSGAWMTWT